MIRGLRKKARAWCEEGDCVMGVAMILTEMCRGTGRACRRSVDRETSGIALEACWEERKGRTGGTTRMSRV